jgi:molybdate transport system permease protein
VNWQPLFLSLQIATIAMLVALVIGTGLALLLVWKKLPLPDVVAALISTPLVLPPTVLGYYLLTAIGKHSAIGRAFHAIFGRDIVFTRLGCVVAATVEALPMVVKSARTALAGVDPTLVAAARTLGAGPVRAFFTVRLPLAAPGIIAGTTLGFARALGDFGVTLMIAGDIPGDTQTAPLYVFDQVTGGHDSLANGMIAVTTAIAIAAMYAANRLTRSRSERE